MFLLCLICYCVIFFQLNFSRFFRDMTVFFHSFGILHIFYHDVTLARHQIIVFFLGRICLRDDNPFYLFYFEFYLFKLIVIFIIIVSIIAIITFYVHFSIGLLIRAQHRPVLLYLIVMVNQYLFNVSVLKILFQMLVGKNKIQWILLRQSKNVCNLRLMFLGLNQNK